MKLKRKHNLHKDSGTCYHDKSLVMRKPAFCICENKDADQLRGNREADQRNREANQHLCFRYLDSTWQSKAKKDAYFSFSWHF